MGLDCAAYLLVRLADEESARRLLQRVVPAVTSAVRRPQRWALNVALTHAWLRTLAVHDELLDSFPAAFREGSTVRARLLGDIGPSAPHQWDLPLGRGETHLVLTVHTQLDQYARTRGHWSEVVTDTGGEVLSVQATHTLENMVERFGYADGAAQPAVQGVPTASRRACDAR